MPTPGPAVPDADRVRHLMRRTVVSVRGRAPSPRDEAWARARLTAPEWELWVRQTAVDRAHSIEVAHAAVAGWGSDDADVAAAALLHDIGKIDARLGVVGRMVATVVAPFVPERWWPRLGRFGRHLGYAGGGARLLAAAGSSDLVVEWARQHHWPRDRWTVETARAEVLAAADDAAS